MQSLKALSNFEKSQKYEQHAKLKKTFVTECDLVHIPYNEHAV